MINEDEIKEGMNEEIEEILRCAITGLNKDSIAVIMLLNRQIDFNESMINTIMSGKVWAEYKGERGLDDMDLNLFEFHLTEMIPRNEEEIYRYQPKKYEVEKDKLFENLETKLPCLLCLQSFLEAGMTDNDAMELFNRYFPEAKIDEKDCNLIRQRTYRKLDKEIEEELEEKSKEIVDIMKKAWHKSQ